MKIMLKNINPSLNAIENLCKKITGEKGFKLSFKIASLIKNLTENQTMYENEMSKIKNNFIQFKDEKPLVTEKGEIVFRSEEEKNECISQLMNLSDMEIEIEFKPLEYTDVEGLEMFDYISVRFVDGFLKECD